MEPTIATRGRLTVERGVPLNNPGEAALGKASLHR
jgi:hypothetical protein